MKNINIIGDSNTICLGVSINSKSCSDIKERFHIDFAFNGAISSEFVLVLNGGEVILNPIITKSFVNARLCHPYGGRPYAYEGTLVLMFGSGLVNSLGLERELSASESDEGWLSEQFLVEVALELLGKFERGLGMIRNFWPDANLMVYGGPPPLKDPSKALAAMKLDHPINSERRRLIYSANMEALRVISNRVNCRFCSPPACILDESGFLAPQFDGDGFHGNALYGEKILRNIINII